MDVYVKSFWMIRSDISKGFKTMLESLRMMQKKLPKMFPIPPDAKNNNILVYTSNDSSEEIEKSAVTIRCYIDFPFIMYYFKKSNPKLTVHYMHTPYQELYEFYFDDSTETAWKLISKKPKPKSATLDELLQTQMPVSEHTHLLTKEEDIEEILKASFDELLQSQVIGRDHIHLPADQEDLGRTPTTTFGELLPSQVTDRENIHLPTDEAEFERVTHGKGGKWLVHCSNLETLDSLWKLLKPLYDGGILIGLKSCTAKSTTYKMSPEYHSKAVMCYTADADCKSSVKVTAEIISNCIRYKNILYYKSNEASLSGKYRHEGYKGVAKYMYTNAGNFFERDHLNRWKAVYFNKEKQQRDFA